MHINLEILQQAWKKVQENNAQGGIDHISIADFQKESSIRLNEIYEKLQLKTFLPQPYLQLKIRKDNNEMRTIGLASVIDKIV